MEILPKMADNSVDFTITDIPYGAVNRLSNLHTLKKSSFRTFNKGAADIVTFDLNDFLPHLLRVTRNNILIFCGREQFSTIHGFFNSAAGTVRPIVWEKTNPCPINGEYVYLSGVEFAVWFRKRGSKVFNARCKNVVFRHPQGTSKYHPTEKNHRLLQELISDNSNEGDTVFDPCMGSGAHLQVALENGRNAIGIELNDRYFTIASDRLKPWYEETSVYPFISEIIKERLKLEGKRNENDIRKTQ